jgi:hypothetical protein
MTPGEGHQVREQHATVLPASPDEHPDAPAIAQPGSVKPHSRAVHLNSLAPMRRVRSLPLIASLPATRDAPVSKIPAKVCYCGGE